MRLITSVLIGSFVLCCSCISSDVRRLATFDAAQKLKAPERPKIFAWDTVEAQLLPELIPFAEIKVLTARTRTSSFRTIWQKAKRLGADVIFIEDGGRELNHQVYLVTLSKLSPARIGLLTNDDKVVISITNDALRKAGLSEGDTVLAIEDIPYVPGNRSGHYIKLTNAKPGDEFSVLWKHGTETRRGIFVLQDNPPTHLELGDALEWRDPRRPSPGQPGWKGSYRTVHF